MQESRRQNKRRLGMFIGGGAVILLMMFGRPDEGIGRADEARSRPAPVPGKPDRSRFVGARTCLDCHRSEYVSWLGTEHCDNSIDRFQISDVSVAKKYLDQGGTLDRCYTCHSAPSEKQFGRMAVESGTSCESCHGAAGGEDGWLNRHAVYGPNLTTLKQETPQHYRARVAFCDKAGMLRPGRQYEVARNCFGCHLIGDPKLINDDVGHPVVHEDFSLVPYLDSEVRHNFHLNQRENAKTPTLDTLRRGLSATERKRVYLVLGQLARMEIALHYLAKLPSDEALEERYADKLTDVFEDGADEIDYYVELLLEPENEDVKPLKEEDVKVLQQAVEAFEAFDDLDEPTRTAAADSAGSIRKLAEQFLTQFGDGSRLAALDVLLEELDDPPSQPLQP